MKQLAFFTVLLTYVLIVFGGYVASSDSGMGCGPDWPLCNGVLVPTLRGATLIEYAHRVIGAILGLMTLLLWVGVLRERSGIARRRAAHWMMLLLIIQVLLGAVVVVKDLPAIVITIHLLVAMVFMAIVIGLWRTTGPRRTDRRNGSSAADKHPFLAASVSLSLFLVFVTIAIGAYIKHQSYGLACGWLDCREQWLPVTGAQLIQTSHRALSVIAAGCIMLLAGVSMIRKPNTPGITRRFGLAAALVAVQVLLGIAAIVTSLEPAWAVIHLAVATLLFAVLVELRVTLGIR